jgi:serine/threonine protein kinase
METAEWTEGTVIRGRYRILSKLGQGGMGAVYKVLHTKFDQIRALKVMTGDMASEPEFVQRFEREAVVMSKIQHPNVVRVDDIDATEDGRPFIVMEYVEGRSLRDVILKEGPLPPARVGAIAKQAAAGLGAAHALGMVHRDIKPDNIVLVETPAGETAKVLDFGIAKLKDARWGNGLHTATGVVIGTPQYLSPEQAEGRSSSELDGRADLYSLGLVMYQMLTGDLPFHSDSPMGWMMVRLQEVPKPIRSVRPGLAIPAPLAELVMRCLEKDRDRRPASAEELIREIKRVEEAMRQAARPSRAAPAPAPSSVPLRAESIREQEEAPRVPPPQRAFARASWARGWRFWTGLFTLVLLPCIVWPVFDRTPYANWSEAVGFLVALTVVALGAGGWWLLTRRHRGLRLAGLLPVGLYTTLLATGIYGVCSMVNHWRHLPPEPSVQTYPIDELIQRGRSPLELAMARPYVDSQGAAGLSLVFHNISSNATVTDWKAHVLGFDDQNKLVDDSAPVNRDPTPMAPGKEFALALSGGPNLSQVKSAKVVFSEVDVEVTNSAGAREKRVWTNPHFQDDLQKAKQP